MSLFKDPISNCLTPAPFDAQARASFPGQAHWGGSGPQGMTCRQCQHWSVDPLSARQSRARCEMYRTLTGSDGALVPARASSCRHFTARSR